MIPNYIIAIDPGNIESAVCVMGTRDYRAIRFGKLPNHEVRRILQETPGVPLWIEAIRSMGMAVGIEVFDTAEWTGRFVELVASTYGEDEVTKVPRTTVKMHHCGSTRAKDTNIVQALVDRFTPGAPNHGKGTKSAPGWFYGFRADVWQAYALGVYAVDSLKGVTP